jgi:hypothetical protein
MCGKHGRNLERAHDAAARGLRGLLVRDVVAVEGDGARGGRQELGQQVEERGLARAVGPISAWMWPRVTFRSTLLTATKPLNSLVRPVVSRMGELEACDYTKNYARVNPEIVENSADFNRVLTSEASGFPSFNSGSSRVKDGRHPDTCTTPNFTCPQGASA